MAAARPSKPWGQTTQTTNSSEADLRADMCAAARRMSDAGLSPGRSGNMSVRSPDGMLITPSGMTAQETTPADIVIVQDDGAVAAGQRKPSSEWHFHLAIYQRRADVSAIVHAHSRFATALACLNEPIPPFHYMVAVAGGRDIPCVPYASFGTDDLGRLVADGVTARNACLMANHGQVAVAATLAAALELAFEVETLAAQYVAARQIGTPKIIDDAEMDRMIVAFQTYGQHGQRR